MSLPGHWVDGSDDADEQRAPFKTNHVVLMVVDHADAQPDLRQVLQRNGYTILDADNGQEAVRNAREIRPDLLVVDMDIPLLYELVAARQIVKHAQVGPMPVVIVTHEDIVDPEPMMEVGASRNEYVTRLSDYQELQHLLDYLLPVLPLTAADRSGTSGPPIGSKLYRESGPPLETIPIPDPNIRY